MTEMDFIRADDGSLVLFLLPEDLNELERRERFPFGLRRGGERIPFTLPAWHPQTNDLGRQFSTSAAKDRYMTTMRAREIIPMTPPEHRIHLHIDRFQAQKIGAKYDKDLGMFFIPDSRPDSEKLRSLYYGGENEKNWLAQKATIIDRRRRQMEYMRSSRLYLFGKIIFPKRGRRPDQKNPTRKAISYFRDLAAAGRINSTTSQSELFKLIVEELAAWSIRVTPDCLRHMDGINWKQELAKLDPPKPMPGTTVSGLVNP